MNSASTTQNALFLEGGGKMGALIRNKDWTSTALGPPENWPHALQTCVRIILTSQQPMFVWWGPDLINIYNDAYMTVLGEKHPASLGTSARESWSEIWDEIGPRVTRVMHNNQGTFDEALLLLMERNGYLEETYFTFSYSPIIDQDGITKGLFCANTDETQRILAERQLRILRELAKNLLNVGENADVYVRTIDSLAGNGKDFPFVILYDVSSDGQTLRMANKLPLDIPETLAAPFIDLSTDSDRFPELTAVLATGNKMLVNDLIPRFGTFPSGFWNDSPEKALLVPIKQQNHKYPYAVLAIGLNPYRKPDANYLDFFDLIADQVGTALTNVLQLKSEQAKNYYDRQLKEIFLQAPIAISVLRGLDFVVETVNEDMIELWGKSTDELLGRPIFDAMPDARGQGFEELLRNVYTTGETFVTNERQIELIRNGVKEKFYIKFIYKPLRDEQGNVTRIMVLADDITEQVNTRKQIELSEYRNKLAIEAAEIGTFEWDMQQQNFIYSERWAQIFGFPKNLKLKQHKFHDLIHEEDEPIRKAAVDAAMQTGVLFYEARFILPDGSIVWIRVNGKVIYDDDGAPFKMYGTGRDISDHKIQSYILEKKVAERTRTLRKKNEQLKQSEERYQRMTEEVQDYAILLLDTNGTILNWNQGAEKIKGYKEEEIVGKNIRTFYLPDDQASNLPMKLIEEAGVNGRAVHEGYRIRKDGTVFWGSIALTALHDKNNNVIGFSKVTRDLTERKIAEDKIKKYNSELEFQNRELEQFAFVASHDLQEPLRKIQMFSDMLERSLDDPELVTKYFQKINSSAERMSELIRAVLNYSRLSRIDQHFEETELDTIKQNVLTDFELLIEEKGAIILSDSLPVIKAIPLQINQLFTNLISNSLKFSISKPIIEIRCRIIGFDDIPHTTNLDPEGNYLELRFSDNGIGFNQKYVAQIFTIFQRLNEKTAFAGTGIGLALCKKIIENHHGFITARGAEGEGATFEIYLPIDN